MTSKGDVITIMITSDNGVHVMGFSIFPPYEGNYEVYDNDGSGNGNHLHTCEEFHDAMKYVIVEIELRTSF